MKKHPKMFPNTKRIGAQCLARYLVGQVTQHGLSRSSSKVKESMLITSVGSERNARSVIKRFIVWLRHAENKDWYQVGIEDAIRFLEKRKNLVRQKTLDADRRGLEHVFQSKIKFVPSSMDTIIQPRALSDFQINVLAENANARFSLAIRLCRDAGLRARELLTIAPTEILNEDNRPWRLDRFIGRDGPLVNFVVVGKGGLRRKVSVSIDISNELALCRLAKPIVKVDRETKLVQYYDIKGGKQFSNFFSAHSKKCLGFSTGGHGLRHSFSKQRFIQIQRAGFSREDAIDILSQELGHFSHVNTMTYLR